MFWTLLALVLMVVVGGFISYYGDLQGRRWGKKRVSWFGLRPKHTAILITSITGSVITLLSVCAMMLVVPNVRDVVLRGEAAIAENTRMKQKYSSELAGLSKRLKELSSNESMNQAELNDTVRRLKKAQSDNADAQQKSSGLMQENEKLARGNMDLQKEHWNLVDRVKQAQARFTEVEKQRANAEMINREIGKQNLTLERENTDLARTNGELKNASQKLQAENGDLVKKNEMLSKSNVALIKIKESLEAAYSNLLNETQDLQDKARTQQSDISRLKSEITELNHQRDNLYSEQAGKDRNFLQTYLALRQARYSLRADTELSRRTIDAHLSPKAVKEELLELLKGASETARRYGAVSGSNGRAVCIVPKRVITPASVQVEEEDASLGAIVDTVAGSNTPVVVVARAINNSLADEQVQIELSSYTSQNVFKQGDVVASRPIDSKQPMDRLVESVVKFLKEDVRNAAIKAGTIPVISPDSGEEQVGIIDTPEMVTLIDRIRRTGGTVQLTAVSNTNLTSADLLTFGQNQAGKPRNLRFELKRLPAKPRHKGDVLPAAE